MPVYEFCCRSCRRKSSVFVKGIDAEMPSICPFCGGSDLMRSVSSFAFHRSEKTRREESRPGAPDYYEDPRNIGRWAEHRAQELGLELPAQVQDMIAAARDGELPEPVKDI